MKKLAFVFAAIVAVSFASCNGNKTTGTECADSTACCGDSVACDGCEDSTACCGDTTACCDSLANDSVVAE